MIRHLKLERLKEHIRRETVDKIDFTEWAISLIEEYAKTNYSNCVVTVYNPEDVKKALEQAYYQGYAQGIILGK